MDGVDVTGGGGLRVCGVVVVAAGYGEGLLVGREGEAAEACAVGSCPERAARVQEEGEDGVVGVEGRIVGEEVFLDVVVV